jgi:hypothetical protein
MNNTHKIAKDWLGRIKIYKVRKSNIPIWIDKGPIDKKNLILKEKFKVRCLKTQLEFFKV